MTRILVCGGRAYQNRAQVFRALDAYTMGPEDMLPVCTIIHGACPTGADRWADEWAVVNWTGLEEYPADWNTYGRAAGPIRNKQMLTEGKPDIVFAFKGGRGTANMIKLAKEAGIEVVEFD